MPFELVPPGTHIDFIGKRRICGALSAVLLLASIAAIQVKGPIGVAPGCPNLNLDILAARPPQGNPFITDESSTTKRSD